MKRLVVPDPLPQGDSPVATADQRIELALRDRFRQCPYAAVRRLGCDVREGVAILHGKVPNYHTRQIAIILARSVDGVHILDDRIRVSQSKNKPK